jgi:hypothetical protein
MGISAEEFREKIRTGQISVTKNGRLKENELLPEYKALLDTKGMEIKLKLKGSTRDNKYNNQIVEYNGYKYQSKKEADYARGLDFGLKAGTVEYWKGQVKFKCEVNGTHVCNYFLDFEVGRPSAVEYIDVKGVQTDVFKLKKRLVEALNWKYDEKKKCYISCPDGPLKVKILLR